MFVPNHRLAKQMETQRDYGDALEAIAGQAKRSAEGIAPRKTGAYARSFIVTRAGNKVYLGNSHVAAGLLELGSRNNPTYAPLRRGVRAIGLKLTEK